MTRAPWPLGWRLVLILAVALTPWVLSGIFRTTFGVSLTAGLWIGGIVALAAGVAAWRLPGPAPVPWRWLAGALALSALLAAYVVWRVYDPLTSGLPNSGTDSVQHLKWKTAFELWNPGQYNGLVVFYTVMCWIERIAGVDPFVSVRVALYASIAAFGAFPGGVVVTFASPATRWLPWFVTLLAAATGLVTLEWFLLPYLAYYESHGFYPHVFGLQPIFLACLGYALASSRAWRLGWLAAGVILSRFTYVLHTGDLIVVAALLGAEELRGTHRRLARVVLFGGLAAAPVVYWRLYLVAFLHGGIQPANHVLLLASSALVAALLLLAPRLTGFMRVELPGPAVRLVRFVGRFVAMGVVVHAVWLVARLPLTYFFHKYAFQRAVVGSLTLAVLVAYLVATSLRWRARLLLPLVAVLAAAAASVVLGAQAVEVYRPRYLERRTPGPRSWERLLGEPAVFANIHQVLQATGRPFGGLITPHKLEGMLAGASFDGPELWFHVDPGFAPPGSCVFWVPPSSLAARGFPGPAPQQREALRVLEDSPDRICVEHEVVLRPGARATLCHRCLEGTSREIAIMPRAGTRWEGFRGLMQPGLWQFSRPLGRARALLDGAIERRDCRLSIWTQDDRPIGVSFDGVPLASADPRRFPIPPALLAGDAHAVGISCPPEIPGVAWKAAYCPQIRYLALDCGEQLPPAPVPPPPPPPKPKK